MILAPVAPSGWPIAIALTLTFFSIEAEFNREILAGKRFVDFEEIHLIESTSELQHC